MWGGRWWLRGLLTGVLLGLLPLQGQADLFDDARLATPYTIQFQDATGVTIRGGVTMQAGQSTVTLFRGNAQIGGMCGSFNFGATLTEAFESIPEIFQQAGIAIVEELPILIMCYLAPTLCDTFKHYQALLNAVIQAKYAQCQSVQNAMAYTGLRLRGGNQSQCLEDRYNAGDTLNQALTACQEPSSLRLPNGQQGATVNLVNDTLDAAGASAETRTLATQMMGEIQLRVGDGGLAVTSERPQAAMLTLYQQHRDTAETAIREAVTELQTTGTVAPATLQRLIIPGQPAPGAALHGLAAMQTDQLRYDAFVAKLSTAMALARLTWQCHQLEDELSAGVTATSHSTEEARLLLQQKKDQLRRNLAQLRETIEVNDRYLQPAYEGVLREYAAIQEQARQLGVRSPSARVPPGMFGSQSPLGYGR